MTLKFKFVDMKHFGPTIDITDPCYDRDVWCRLNDVKIKEGEYICGVWTTRKCYQIPLGKLRYYTVICKIGIYHGNVAKPENLEKIGSIGVDAGLAGFFENKPDYTDEEWSKLCADIDGKEYLINNEGFFSSSGDRDGEYDVYAEKDTNGEIISLEIVFM